MGKKIFVSYKYSDRQVQRLAINNLGLASLLNTTTVRDYVTILQSRLEAGDHINKGEADNESLASFKEETIASKLRDKIFDSSVTIILVSKGMKNPYLPESDQWMPWEISYSLRNQPRADKTSRTNALLAVALPDENGSYEYYITLNTCQLCKCRMLNTHFLFEIMRKNMFNIKAPVFSNCSNHSTYSPIYLEEASYIHSVRWDDFISNMNGYIKIAEEINSNIKDYNIIKNL